MRSPSTPVSQIAHACLVADSLAEKKAALLPYLKDGLEQGDRCILITDDRREDDWCFELQAYGVDVDAERRADKLVVRRSELTRLTGEFNSVSMARNAWTCLQSALETHPSVRMAVDVTAAYAHSWSPAQICHWDATIDLLFHDMPVQVLCTYDRAACSLEDLEGALRTHPEMLMREAVRANRSYDARAVLAEEQIAVQHAGWPLKSRD